MNFPVYQGLNTGEVQTVVLKGRLKWPSRLLAHSQNILFYFKYTLKLVLVSDAHTLLGNGVHLCQNYLDMWHTRAPLMIFKSVLVDAHVNEVIKTTWFEQRLMKL